MVEIINLKTPDVLKREEVEFIELDNLPTLYSLDGWQYEGEGLNGKSVYSRVKSDTFMPLTQYQDLNGIKGLFVDYLIV